MSSTPSIPVTPSILMRLDGHQGPEPARSTADVAADSVVPCPEDPSEPAVVVHVEGVSKTYRNGRTTFYEAGVNLLRRFRGRKRAYGSEETEVLRGISFDIRRGESVGLIGRNGSGKSTLLKIITGVLRATTGAVATFGRVESMLELGIGFNPDFTGRENIFLYATLLGMNAGEIRRRHEEVAAFAEIGDYMDLPLRHYSSGMVLRLAFAAFVLMRPDVLLIDEALAVGDIFFQQRCYDFLRGPLNGSTKIIVSHDPAALSALCTRLLILDRGNLDYDGPIAPGIERYLRSLHNEGSRPNAAASHALAETASHRLLPADIPWVGLPEGQLSGQGSLRIIKAAVTSPDGQAIQGREAGQRVVVHMIVRALEARSHLMFGYLLRDGTGQQVCGQNSHVLRTPGGARLNLDLPEPGDWYTVLEFDWPALKPQPYTLTLGIGEGFDAHHHVVQCWAHDCFQIAGFDPENQIHGLFGSGLVECRRTKL